MKDTEKYRTKPKAGFPLFDWMLLENIERPQIKEEMHNIWKIEFRIGFSPINKT